MEHRSAVRQRVVKAGTIKFDGGAISCVVRNMSDSGAMLDVASAAGIPEHFTLIMRGNSHRTPCQLVWHKEKRLGVAFV